jgi:hypothetical protein
MVFGRGEVDCRLGGAGCGSGRSRIEHRRFHQPADAGPFAWGAAAPPNLEYGVVRRFPMRWEVAWGGEAGLPHGTTWFGLRTMFRAARSSEALQASGLWRAGTPGSRWRGNPGLWKSSPTGNGPVDGVRGGEGRLLVGRWGRRERAELD